MLRIGIILLLLAGLGGCAPKGTESSPAEETEKDQAQEIIDQAIEAHGSQKVSGHIVEFDFRDRHYISKREGGVFQYERIFTDTLGDRYRDVLTNDGFYREINGELAEVSEEYQARYSNSVNSVLYFALLPYYLNDAAVKKKYLGKAQIKGVSYHKILITFRQEGGGKDFEDQFLYWIHEKNYTIDYLAYNYLTDGGGARLREAFNVRKVGGIRFADYINYKPLVPSMKIETFDRLLEQDSMVELSKIISENVVVKSME